MRKSVFWTLVAIAYVLLFCLLFFVIDPRCYHIFQQQSFLLTSDFFLSKVHTPGGMGMYLSLFIEQFLRFRFLGSLLLVAETFLMALLAVRYVNKAFGRNNNLNLLIWILPVAFSAIVWDNIKYPFAINMQILILIAMLNIHQLMDGKKIQQYVTPVMALLLYNMCGPIVLYVFALCNVILYFVKPSRLQLINLISSVFVSALYPFIVYKLLLPVKPDVAFYSILPQLLMYTTFNVSFEMTLLFAFMPLSLILAFGFTKFALGKKQLICILVAYLLILSFPALFSNNHGKIKERMEFKMQLAIYHQDWDKAINYVKNNPFLANREYYSRNITFYYDMALAYKGQLGDKIFTFPQLYGDEGLFLDKPVATNICLPLATFYYDLGFVTGALHYAFEAQTTYPNSPYIMEYVIDCLITIGDYTSARIFLNKYENIMMSHKFVADRRAFIDGRTDTELSGSYIDQIRANHPKRDFYTSWGQNNVLQMFSANNENLVASQYLVCCALLRSDFDLFVNLLLNGYAYFDNNNMPKSYQEALVLYKAMNKNVNPEVDKIKIQPYIIDQFKNFQQVANSKSPNKMEIIESRFGSTYWKYYYVDNPKVTGISLTVR